MKAAAPTKQVLRCSVCILTALAIAAPQIARADELTHLLLAPATTTRPTITPAVSFELKFRLAQQSDLPDLLLQAQVNSDDIVTATKLAAGHDGGPEGCYVKIAVSKPLGEKAFRLQRVTLVTETSQTVMERRNGALTISATLPRSDRSRIV